MDVRQLRYFVAVAEELSFSRAAERLHVSQPPLSVQIKAMEEELHATLFSRTKRRVALTHAGEVLLASARTVLSELDRASDMTRRAGRGEAGRLAMGFTSSAPMLALFTRILRGFRSRYPAATVEARLMSTGQQIAALNRGEIDVGFIRPAHWFKPAAGVSVRPIWRDELNVFLPDDHPLLAREGALRVETLVEEAFIVVASEMGCGLSEHLDMLCSRAGFRPRIAQEATSVSLIPSLVAAGVGIAILPACQALSGIVGVLARPLAAANTLSDLLLAHRKGEISPLLRRFLEVAEEEEVCQGDAGL
jgi:DNA-binding transcriptional LysR family regulator